MYEDHTEIISGMCVRKDKDGAVLMCDKVREPSGLTDAVPMYAIQYPAGFVCKSYAFPRSRERVGGCPLCSIKEVSARAANHKLNPIKASKRK